MGHSAVRFRRRATTTFMADMKAIITDLAPGSIFHPSLCDLGEQHFWTAAAGMIWEREPYQVLFDAKTGFVSEYGGISLSSYENLGKYLTPAQQWGVQVAAAAVVQSAHRYDGLRVPDQLRFARPVQHVLSHRALDRPRSAYAAGTGERYAALPGTDSELCRAGVPAQEVRAGQRHPLMEFPGAGPGLPVRHCGLRSRAQDCAIG